MRPMGMGDIEEIAAVVAVHDGIITASQALAIGLTRGAITARVERGVWRRVGHGVYLSAAHPFTERARLRAAVAAYRGTAAGTAAAWWHGLIPDLEPVITITVPRSRRARVGCVARVVASRRQLHADDIEIVDGLSVTGRSLTVLDCAEALAEGDGARLMDRALVTGEITVGGLSAALDRNSSRRGMGEARRLIGVVETDSESEAERRFVTLLRREGIGGWVQRPLIGRYRADFAFIEQRVVVEIDGWAFHRDEQRCRSDRDKRSAMAVAGWRSLVFTWHEVVSDPAGTLDALAAELRERGRRTG